MTTLPDRIAAATENERVTDDLVWLTYQAMRDEGARWRVLDFNGRGAMAVNDQRTAHNYSLPCDPSETFERYDFSTAKDAQDYVEWRAVKAGLIAAAAILATQEQAK